MEQLTLLLEKLADKLGTTVEHLWGVLLQQVNIEIILCNLWINIWMWGGVGVTLILIVIIIMMVKSDNSELVPFPIMAILTFGSIAVLGVYTNYSKLLTLENNPEYWVLEQVLRAIN